MAMGGNPVVESRPRAPVGWDVKDPEHRGCGDWSMRPASLPVPTAHYPYSVLSIKLRWMNH